MRHASDTPQQHDSKHSTNTIITITSMTTMTISAAKPMPKILNAASAMSLAHVVKVSGSELLALPSGLYTTRLHCMLASLLSMGGVEASTWVDDTLLTVSE